MQQDLSWGLAAERYEKLIEAKYLWGTRLNLWGVM